MQFKKLKPLFILGHRRSGTTLLTSLLDFHNEILMYPDDSKFFHLYYPFVDLQSYSKKQKQELMIKKNFKYLRDTLLKKVKINEKSLNFDLIERDFLKLTKDKSEWHHFLNAMIESFFNNSIQEKRELKYWAEKTTSSEIYIEEIIKKYKNAKFIHIIRDPRAIYASLKSGWKSHYRNFKDSATLDLLLQSCIDRYGYSAKLVNNNIKRFGPEKYLVIRYEDLVKKHSDTLNNIKIFLGLNHEIKNDPTIYGKKWKGNNFSLIKFNKINNKRSDAWKGLLSLHEKGLLDFHFNNFLRSYNYKNLTNIKIQNNAANKHYKWHNFRSQYKADI